MQLDIEKCWELLNYDSNTRKFLTYSERIRIHGFIRKESNGISYSIPNKLQEKFKPVLADMKATNWVKTDFEHNEEL